MKYFLRQSAWVSRPTKAVSYCYTIAVWNCQNGLSILGPAYGPRSETFLDSKHWRLLGASVTTAISVILGISGRVPLWGLFLMGLASCALSLFIISKVIEVRAGLRATNGLERDSAHTPITSASYWPSGVILAAILGFGAWQAVSHRMTNKIETPKPVLPTSETKSEPAIAIRNTAPSVVKPTETALPDMAKQRLLAKRKPELLAPASSAPSGVVISAPSGIAIGGGTVTNPTVNNFGPPLPKLSWRVESRALRSLKDNQVFVWLSVDRALDIPAFIAKCDRPCKTTGGGANLVTGGVGYLTTKYPDHVGLTFKIPRPLGAGSQVYWEIESMDDSPLTILSVDILPASGLPESLR